jgi:hypothetical protein
MMRMYAWLVWYERTTGVPLADYIDIWKSNLNDL